MPRLEIEPSYWWNEISDDHQEELKESDANLWTQVSKAATVEKAEQAEQTPWSLASEVYTWPKRGIFEMEKYLGLQQYCIPFSVAKFDILA